MRLNSLNCLHKSEIQTAVVVVVARQKADDAILICRRWHQPHPHPHLHRFFFSPIYEFQQFLSNVFRFSNQQLLIDSRSNILSFHHFQLRNAVQRKLDKVPERRIGAGIPQCIWSHLHEWLRLLARSRCLSFRRPSSWSWVCVRMSWTSDDRDLRGRTETMRRIYFQEADSDRLDGEESERSEKNHGRSCWRLQRHFI